MAQQLLYKHFVWGPRAGIIHIFREMCKHLGKIIVFGGPAGVPEAFWDLLEASWGFLGASWGALGTSWGSRGVSWALLRTSESAQSHLKSATKGSENCINN